MQNPKCLGRLLLACFACSCLLLPPASAQDYPYDEGGYDQGSGGGGGYGPDRFYFGLSVGDGAYVNVRCSSNYGCHDVYVTPLDMELLFGMRMGPFLYLDLGVNMGFDYYLDYYAEMAYILGLRPGMRLVFPLPFHRSLYFRAAVPVQYAMNEVEDRLLLGLLLGFGAEWRFENLGWFIEGDITPYFFRIYPGHYVIPAQARIGFSVRF